MPVPPGPGAAVDVSHFVRLAGARVAGDDILLELSADRRDDRLVARYVFAQPAAHRLLRELRAVQRAKRPSQIDEGACVVERIVGDLDAQIETGDDVRLDSRRTARDRAVVIVFEMIRPAKHANSVLFGEIAGNCNAGFRVDSLHCRVKTADLVVDDIVVRELSRARH